MNKRYIFPSERNRRDKSLTFFGGKRVNVAGDRRICEHLAEESNNVRRAAISKLQQRAGSRDKRTRTQRNPITAIVETPGDGMCSCFYLRLSKQLLGGLGTRLADEIADMIVRIKRGLSTCCYSQPPEPPERSPDKKSATLPHAGSNTSLSPNERATRPLPLPPDTQSYTDKPWYHNVTREQAIILIGEQSTYNNSQDGYFLLRPSTTKVRNPFVLVLWYKDRVYNVPVRKRNDNRYALGSQKVGELFFSTIEEIVAYYTKHELMLESGGVPIGSTILTDTPPK